MEEATIREKEAHDNYNKLLIAVHSQQAHMAKTQRDLIMKTKDNLSLLEMKIKEVTTHYFETLTNSMTFSPAQIGKTIDDTSKYEFGKSYRDFASPLPAAPSARPSIVSNHQFPFNAADFKPEIDSSESDTNSPPYHATVAHEAHPGSKFPISIEFDSSLENEMNGTMVFSFNIFAFHHHFYYYSGFSI